MTEVYVSVDVEASGDSPVWHSLLSIGAVVVDTELKTTFYEELKPKLDVITNGAQRVVGDLFARCKKSGGEPKAAMGNFEHWLRSLSGRPIMVGFNTSFDFKWIDHYFHEYLGYNPFGINSIDIKAYYMGMVGCDWHDTTKERIRPEFKSHRKHTHNALDDALEQAELFSNMLRFSKSAGGAGKAR